MGVRPWAALAAALIVAGLLWYVHDRFWWPIDEGVYAYVAQQMLRGTRIHVDLIDVHAGYGNVINALSMAVFGEDLLSMRYPLMLATALQAAAVFVLLQPRGQLAAFAGAIAAAAFGAPMFLNPSANWYALALFFLTVLLLKDADPRQTRTIILAGFLVGLCFLIRQLNGVFLAMGIVALFLVRMKGEDRGSSIAPLTLALLTAAGLAAYLVHKASPFAAVLFGLWPLLIVLLAGFQARVTVRLVLRWLLWGGAGVLLAALPLAIYNAGNGALAAWLHDMLFTALLINGQQFIPEARFAGLFAVALAHLLSPPDAVAFLSGLAWIALMALAPVSGFLAVREVWKKGADAGALPVLAAFWAVLAMHYEIPIYLFFVLAPLLASVLSLSRGRAVPLAVLALSLWAFVFQAAQPLSRSLGDMIQGRRSAAPVPAGLPRVSLLIPSQDREVFSALLARIEEAARPGEALVTIPMDPELNFMTGRPTPLGFYGTPLGLRTPEDVEAAFDTLLASAPLFVVNRRNDKYLTLLSRDLLTRIAAASPAPEAFGPFDVYRLPAPEGAPAGSAR